MPEATAEDSKALGLTTRELAARWKWHAESVRRMARQRRIESYILGGRRRFPFDAVREHGGQKTERLRVVDWENPPNNDFLLVSQFSVTGALYTCRPDLVCFVNGLPVVVIELKKPGVPARAAFDENLTHYKQQIPALFWYNALLVASNGTDSRVGSLTADWERFFEWKRIQREDEPRRVSLEVMIRGTCDRVRLLDLVENFTLFSEHKAGLVKIIGQNHQFLGVNSAIASMLAARKAGHGRGGVFWQTQGSGKSLAMVFFAQKVLRKVPGNWTFVVVTDRVELDDQIAKTFKATGAVSEAEGDLCHAASGARLRELLRGNHRYVFTLIHKFQTPELLCDRPDVIVLTDEAHRSQYDTLALNMRAALPRAMFLAFTGTPLIAGEERTKDVFGDYVSIYDFQQSVEDGATVPLYYENRTPELQLVNPDLNDDIYNLIESAELDPEQEAKLERELSKQYHILTRDDRLETVAQDIVRHFLGRGFNGKGMVVSIDKATALKMHDKVRKHWAAETARVRKELARYDLAADKKDELLARLQRLESADMALIVSPGQNEIEQMKKHGLVIVPHRKRMNESQPPLDEKFKDPEDPLRLVFLCAMWLTGFDAPSCSTVYLDKPMRNHTLMQTIARANRVFPGKHSGMIVDYANVFASLEKALAIYGAGKDGKSPVKDKKKLVDDLRKAVHAATAFSGLLQTLDVRLQEAVANRLGHAEFLELICQDEVNVRQQRMMERRTKAADFRGLKTLEDFDWSFNPAIHRKDIYDLATGNFIRQSKDVLFLGPPGVGKTHLAQAIGYEAIKMNFQVLYRSIFDLVRDFMKDEAFSQQDRTLRRYLNPELLIIDDFGLKQLPKNSGEHLFEVIMRRYENRSTIMTSNRPLEEWGKLLGDVPTAGAILDRFLHHAQTIAITGRSYRLKDHATIAGKEDKNKKVKSKSNEPSTAEPAS